MLASTQIYLSMYVSVTKPKVVISGPSEVTVWKAVFDWEHCVIFISVA